MAITEVYFTAGTYGDDNRAEVYTFLRDYGGGTYFDSISTSPTDKNVVCTVGETDAITLYFDNTSRDTYTLANGQSNSEYSTMNHYFRKAFVTSCGLYLPSTQKGSCIFITKNSNGDTVALVRRMTNGSNSTFEVYDFKNASAVYTFFSTAANPIEQRTLASGATSLVPVVTTDTKPYYCPKLFYTPQTQYHGRTPEKFLFEGKEYVYDGAFALEE